MARLDRGLVVDEDGNSKPLGPNDLAVITPHVGQASAVAARLADVPDVLIGTANEAQGLEREEFVATHAHTVCRPPHVADIASSAVWTWRWYSGRRALPPTGPTFSCSYPLVRPPQSSGPANDFPLHCLRGQPGRERRNCPHSGSGRIERASESPQGRRRGSELLGWRRTEVAERFSGDCARCLARRG